MCGHEYERLALRFAASKDGALAQEAGSCAMRHLVESCYLRRGAKFWGMEANKLWRTCTKKMRARQKSLVRRGNSALGTLLTRAIYKCARRLAPERPSASPPEADSQRQPSATAQLTGAIEAGLVRPGCCGTHGRDDGGEEGDPGECDDKGHRVPGFPRTTVL